MSPDIAIHNLHLEHDNTCPPFLYQFQE